MINKVNNISFSGKFHFSGYSKHTPKPRPYEEFHFMPELKNENPIKKFFKRMIESYKGIRDAMKLVTKNADIEKSEISTGMHFEA